VELVEYECTWSSTRVLNWPALTPMAFCLHLAKAFTYISTEWIKGLLAVPFVLHSQPTGVFESRAVGVEQMAEVAHRRYAEIMKDVEDMIDDHSM